MNNIYGFLANIQIGSVSGWDVFMILVLLVAILVYAYSLGRNRMIVLLLSSYFSLSIVQVMPWSKISSWGWLGIGSAGPSASTKVLIFLGLLLAFYFLIPRSILSSAFRIRKRGEAVWLQLFLLGIVQVGLLVMVILSFLPAKNLAGLTSVIRRVFVGAEARFVWTLLPVLTMVLMRRQRSVE